MAYSAEIKLVVKGAKQLKQLSDQVKVTEARISVLNDNLSALGNKIPRSISNINAVLQKAAKNFNDAALGTERATEAARDYFQTNKALNNALRERARLLKNVEQAERGAALANIKASQAARAGSGFSAFSGGIDLPTQKAIRRNAEKTAKARAVVAREVAKVNAAAGPPQLLLPPAAPGSPAMSGGARRRITGPTERLGGARTADQAAMTLRRYEGAVAQSSQALTKQTKAIHDTVKANIKRSQAERKVVAQTKQLNQELKQRNRLERQLAKRGLMQLSTGAVVRGTDAGFGAQGPALPPHMVRAQRRKARGAGRGMGARFARAGGIGGVLATALPGAAISAAFPLLTGQGAGGAIGGGIGGLAGGILGSILGPGGAAMGSFAGGLIGSIIGEKFDEAKALTKELKEQQELIRGINDLEVRGMKLTIGIAKARQRGNEIQAIELERRQKNNQIAQQLFKTITKLNADERNKTEAGRKLVEFEKNRAGFIAKQAVDQNNILSAMRKQGAELEKQLQASSMLTERRLAGVGAKEARGQQKFDVATARFDMLLKVNDLELQRARNAGETAKEYKLQLHRANLIYKQTLLQVKQELQRNKLAAIREKIELLGLQSDLRQKQRAGENVDFLVQEVDLRRQAVQIANEGVTAAEQMAAFQIRGAEAVRTMAVEQLKYNKNKAAGEARAAGFAGAGSGTGVTIAGYSGTRSIGALTDRQIATRLSELGVTGTFTPMQASALLNRMGSQPRKRYAKGGYVTRPTNAVIGEAGESEYVIPASKMNRAMQRYSAGVRGEAVTAGAVGAGSTTNANYSSQQNMYYGGGGTSVNITTGPVIRMNNRDYVAMSDLQRGMSTAVGAAESNMMGRMSRSYSTRRSMGL